MKTLFVTFSLFILIITNTLFASGSSVEAFETIATNPSDISFLKSQGCRVAKASYENKVIIAALLKCPTTETIKDEIQEGREKDAVVSPPAIEQTDSDSATSQVLQPIIITDTVCGVSRLYDDFYTDTLLFRVKNQGSKGIRIKGISANGMTEDIWYGNRQTGAFGHPEVNPYGCDPEDNLVRGCNIIIPAGIEIDLQLKVPLGTCNRGWSNNPYSPPSVNSVKKSSYGNLVFYYEYVQGLPTPVAEGPLATHYASNFNFAVRCLDYWLCEDNYWNLECIEKYTLKGHWCVKGGCGYSFVGEPPKNSSKNRTCAILPMEIDCGNNYDRAIWYDEQGCAYKCKVNYGKAGSDEKDDKAPVAGEVTDDIYDRAPSSSSSNDNQHSDSSDSLVNSMVADGDFFARAMILVGVYLEKFRK